MNRFNTDKEFNYKVQLEFIELVEKYRFINLPKEKETINHWSSIGSSFEIEFMDNFGLQGSDYLADANVNYLHFTSIDKLKSIIKSKSIRLYNYHKSNDPTEYSYAVELLKDLQYSLNFTDDIIKRREEAIKSQLFYISLTSMNSINSNKHWEEYANCKKGVAIEFAIKDDITKWESIYFSKIKYEKRNEFQELISKLIEFHKIYKINNGLFYVHFDPFMGLHKTQENYKWEDEVRILIDFYKRNRIDNRKLVYDDKNIGNNVKYFELPLWSIENEDMLKEVELRGDFSEKDFNDLDTSDIPNRQFPLPQLVIKKFHYMNKANKDQMENLRENILEGLGYDVEIEFHEEI